MWTRSQFNQSIVNLFATVTEGSPIYGFTARKKSDMEYWCKQIGGSQEALQNELQHSTQRVNPRLGSAWSISEFSVIPDQCHIMQVSGLSKNQAQKEENTRYRKQSYKPHPSQNSTIHKITYPIHDRTIESVHLICSSVLICLV